MMFPWHDDDMYLQWYRYTTKRRLGGIMRQYGKEIDFFRQGSRDGCYEWSSRKVNV